MLNSVGDKKSQSRNIVIPIRIGGFIPGLPAFVSLFAPDSQMRLDII